MTSRSCFEGLVSGLYWSPVELAAMILLSTWTLFHLHCQKTEIDCRIKFWSTITLICMCFSCVVKCLADGYCLTSNPDDGISYSLRYASTALAASSLVFILILFIMRLKITFINTVFDLSSKTYQRLISLCIFLCIMFIVFVSLITFGVNLIIISCTYVFCGFVFLAVCVSVIYLFSARMIGMTNMMKEKEKRINRRAQVQRAQSQSQAGKSLPGMNQTVYDSSSSTDDEGIQKMNQIQLRLLKITSRYTLLACIALFSSILTVILELCGIIVYTLEIVKLYKLPGYPMIRYITHQWVFFDLGINLICLILQFPFSQKFYQKYCIYCDNKCHSIMANKIESSNEKNLPVSFKSGSVSNANSNPMSPSHGSGEIIIIQ